MPVLGIGTRRWSFFSAGFSAGLLAAFPIFGFVACQERSADAKVEAGVDATAMQTTPADTPQVVEKAAAPETTARETTQAQAAGAAAPAGADVYQGWKMYAVNCERCHGQDALGSALAPDLRKSATTLGHDGFVQVVKSGRTAKGMPPFEGALAPQKIESIYAYAAARASGDLGPGRPKQ
ncbi:MAG: c-type cytochrome [Gemmatimonadetes bacterium]|nr:c-type cytochrome [Gemmatimonadota bacterium]